MQLATVPSGTSDNPERDCLRYPVIIADAENHLIRIYDPKEGSLKTLLGRETKLNRPHGVTFHKGWLYIADSWNNRVLRIRL